MNMAMVERYNRIISIPASKTANYVNEVADTIKTVAALGRERETMRVYDMQVTSAPRRSRYLILGAGGFALGQAVIVLTAALLFHWIAQRLAHGAVLDACHLCDFAHPVSPHIACR